VVKRRNAGSPIATTVALKHRQQPVKYARATEIMSGSGSGGAVHLPSRRRPPCYQARVRVVVGSGYQRQQAQNASNKKGRMARRACVQRVWRGIMAGSENVAVVAAESAHTNARSQKTVPKR